MAACPAPFVPPEPHPDYKRDERSQYNSLKRAVLITVLSDF